MPAPGPQRPRAAVSALVSRVAYNLTDISGHPIESVKPATRRLGHCVRLDLSRDPSPPRSRSREGGAGGHSVELLYRVFPMNSTYRYLPIYTELLYRDFPTNSTYRYRYLKH